MPEWQKVIHDSIPNKLTQLMQNIRTLEEGEYNGYYATNQGIEEVNNG